MQFSKYLYNQIMRRISNSVKHILNEDIQSFDVADYKDNDIIDQQTTDSFSLYRYFPKNRDEFTNLIDKRVKENPKEPYLLDIDTSEITEMSYIFILCNETEVLNLSTWNTSNVTSMYGMFKNCKSLKKLVISNYWDTSNVIEMNSMFEHCNSLETLDLTNLNTSNVTDMSYMFYGCTSLKELDISTWDVSNVTNMIGMFHLCKSLKELDLSNWYTPSLTNMSLMFYRCALLKELDLSNWDTSSLKQAKIAFARCESLKNVYAKNNKTLQDIFNICHEQNEKLCENRHNFDVIEYEDDDTIDNHSVNNVLWNFLYADELNDIFTDIEWTKFNIVNRDFVSYIRIYNNNSDDLVIYQLRDWFHKYTKETEYGFDSAKDGIDSTTAFIYNNEISSDEIILYILDDNNDYLEYSFSNKYDSYERKQYTLFKIQRISQSLFDVYSLKNINKKIPIAPVKLINFYLKNKINLKFGGEKELRYGKLVNP